MPNRGIILALVGLLMAMAILILALFQFKHHEPRSAGATNEPRTTNADSAPSLSRGRGTEGEGGLYLHPSESSPVRPTDPPPRPLPPEGVPLVEVTIDNPQENESVPRTFQVSGHCSRVPRGKHLVMAIQTGSVFSPKWPPVQVQGDTWTGRAMEYGVRSGGTFTLCVFEVTDAGLEDFFVWDAEAVKPRRWPPFGEIPGGTLLTSIKLRVATQPK